MYKNEIEQIKQKVEVLLKESKKEIIVIAIDGMTGSGKTTLAEELSQVYNAPIFHADDYFLPPELRTEERLNEPGGNIHYEKMKKEIIDILVEGKINSTIKYKPFICKKQSYGEEKSFKLSKINIVEGSYCLNPYFGKYYDISVFLTINEKSQIERLTKRCPQMINNFINKWIPLEKKYHDAFKLYDNCDIKFSY
jgi:uridine kinase